MRSKRISGFRGSRAARRRAFRRRAAFVSAAGICLVLTAGMPRTADASWSAMLTQAIAQVNEALDTWEKHTRQLEDLVDQGAGMVQPFSELHAGYRELTDTRRLRSLARMGQVYRAGISDPSCFTSGGDCRGVRDFVPSEIRSLDNRGDSLFRTAVGYQNLSWREFERLVRVNLAPESRGVGGVWFTRDAPEYVREALDLSRDINRTMTRVQYNKARSYRSVRRSQQLASRYQHLGNDVLRVSRARGESSGDRSNPDVNSDITVPDRETGDLDCHAGDAASLVTGTAVAGEGPTLLAQVLEMDCRGGMDGSGQALLPNEPGAHASQTELATVQAAVELWQAQAAAAQLEDAAMELARQANGRLVRMEDRRRKMADLERRLQCPQAPMLLDCSDYRNISIADLVAETDRALGAGLTAREYAEQFPIR